MTMPEPFCQQPQDSIWIHEVRLDFTIYATSTTFRSSVKVFDVYAAENDMFIPLFSQIVSYPQASMEKLASCFRQPSISAFLEC